MSNKQAIEELEENIEYLEDLRGKMNYIYLLNGAAHLDKMDKIYVSYKMFNWFMDKEVEKSREKLEKLRGEENAVHK